MGGSAFSAVLIQGSFPRMPPAVYIALKGRLLPRLRDVYEYVGIPLEAPEKTTYGDLDFVVAGPKVDADSESEVDTGKGVVVPVNAPHILVQRAIVAQHVNPVDGNRTSNFAVPIVVGEWGEFGHNKEEDEARNAVETGEIFYQVDINVCTDKEEWERVMFFHAYGDLGIIMSLIARNAGIALGEKGLRLPIPNHQPVQLSQSFDQITEFMGWSMERRKAGFHTKREAFEWAGSSRFFNPSRFRARGEGFGKVKPDRKMYAEFVQWALEKQALAPKEDEDPEEVKEAKRIALQDQVLNYFKMKEAFDAMAHERSQRARLKEIWNGTRVRDWAQLGGYWKGVKLIMDTIRVKLGGDDGVSKLIDEEGEEGVKRAVLEAKNQLSITSPEEYPKQSDIGLTTVVDNLATVTDKVVVIA
ncbi:hypothetical protein FRB94_000464 [Tulasnella sp. JGI-2019a]|nr:hypothetical protein FRB94_000464 [Tulasnella sp. JGI-2019a]KAG9010357.1 hypothetical protein FRB93_004196 [Tulasnella sp. JGI-2019a]KAG9038649.1 hypothetical protein FRB95_000238 [Tulasnella sp. JGI-2019a]